MPENQGLTDPLLDAKEAARLLHVPRSTLYELVRSRGLPHVQIGKRGMRFTRSDLARWISENSVRRQSTVSVRDVAPGWCSHPETQRRLAEPHPDVT